MRRTDGAARRNGSRRAVIGAAGALVLAAGAGGFALAPAGAGGSPERSLTVAQVNGADRTVAGVERGKWQESCSGDVCSSTAPGVSTFELPAAWAGESVRLSVEATIDVRMRGTNRARVGAFIGRGELAADRTRLAPKRWNVRQAGKKYGTQTVSFTKRVTVPEDGVVVLTVNGPSKDRSHRIDGKKVLWKVTASA